MTKAEKSKKIDELAETLKSNNVIYLADTSELAADATSRLRRECFKRNIKLEVVKNSLLSKAFDKVEERNFGELKDVLAGSTAIMLSEVGNAPAKLIEQFRKKLPKPLLKGAYIDEAIFVGDDQLKMLSAIKSKEELVGEIIGLLQSPAKNVISALQSGGSTIAGLVKTLSERAD
jgi:large subunit ribosomal protein L10